MPEQKLLAELSVENIRAHVKHIVETIPSRLAGSENAARMADYSAEQFHKAELDTQIHTLPGLVSFPGSADLRVLGPEEKVIAANTLGFSLPTLPEGIAGELVYVGSGSFADYEGKNVVGKITMSELSYSPGRHEKQRIAGLMGSIAQIMRNWGPPENKPLPFGCVKPAWGNPTPETAKTQMPTIPCIGISRPAGQYLLNLCEKGQVRVWLRTNVENGWRDLKLTTAEIMIPGLDDFVMVGGHQDSWYGEAATDNAAGNACMMELARVFSKYRSELRRGLVFGFWPGHENGTMTGSAWFVDRNWDRLREHAVAYLMIDQPAMVGTSRWAGHSNVELRRFHQAAEHRVLGDKPIDWHLAEKIGDSSFFGLGIPALWAEGGFTKEELQATAFATFGWWHHSLECTFDKVDWNWMVDHIKVYGSYLWDLCTAPILPFEFVSVADQILARLESLRVAGQPIGLSGTIERAKVLKQVAVRLDETVQSWSARYRSGREKDEGPAELLNACIKRLSRLLVPIASTAQGTYGHDTYGFTPQTTMIPCLYEVPRLLKLSETGEERWQLETKLVRERNRVTDALADATITIEQTLARIK
jgi:hypothetical protein